MTDKTKDKTDLTLFQVAHSILAAFIGIQSKENHRRDDDFIEKRGLLPYVVMGFALAILFHVIIYSIVQLVIP